MNKYINKEFYSPIKEYGLTKDILINFYRIMVRIRYFENHITDLYSKGLMPGLAHLYIGEEAIATGVCANLTPKDWAISTHRGHGHVIAQGADLKKMMAEILGKKNGYCKGKGGSMHVADFSRGILGANAIVGAGIPIATGAAYSAKVRGTNQVSVAFFGDGATNQGTFHESLNMASAWKLPVIYVCENNFYGISVDIRNITAVDKIADRAIAYAIPGIEVDGNDVMEVYQVTKEAMNRARKGKGPTLIEAKTYRWKGHNIGDPGNIYRIDEEKKKWIDRCPIKTYKKRLIEEEIVKEEELISIEKSAKELVEEAIDFAMNSPYPQEEEVYQDIFLNERRLNK
jgi:pyruvate dehydrogenase E1 component alpha subunit